MMPDAAAAATAVVVVVVVIGKCCFGNKKTEAIAKTARTMTRAAFSSTTSNK